MATSKKPARRRARGEIRQVEAAPRPSVPAAGKVRLGRGGAAPEDSPRLRFQELIADRQFGTDPGASLARLRLDALQAARAVLPGHETSLTPATPGGSNWVELGPTAIPNGQTYGGARVIVTGRVTEIVPHPTDAAVIYVGAARGGVWKTTDGGITWLPKSDHEASLAIGALAIARSNPDTLYAGTGEGNIFYYRLSFPLNSINASYEGAGILKTTDGGDTWTLQGSAVFTGACFFRAAVDPTHPDIAFAASNLGLHRTRDGGATWDLQAGGLPAISSSVLACTDVAIDPSDPDIAYTAFWADGVYKSTNATKHHATWTKLAGGLPVGNLSRIALAVSPTAPSNVYVMAANASDGLNGLYASADGGATWTSIAGAVAVYGAYTLRVTVDISTANVVYLSGVELYKAVRSAGAWSITNIGGKIHPDNHAFAGHPTDPLTIYAGSDGGIYRSSDGGVTWDDGVNEGLNLTQFEFIGQHPTSDAYIIGGTQDNGTEVFRNHPAFYHSADGDGGAAGVDVADPKSVIHTYYGASPARSTQGGKFGTYAGISAGLAGASLFYPPFAYDDTNSQNLAFGTDRINLDGAQGTGGWPTKVTLAGISGDVSAVTQPNSSLVFAGTSSGQVYRLVKSAGVWTATAIHAAPLPSRWIWDIAVTPGDLNTIVVVMAGFGVAHVWRGAVAAAGTSATWTDISGTAPSRVPDVPVNALTIDPLHTDNLYVGTDVGVFRTVDNGAHWSQFSDGLPNTAVYDLRLHGPTRLLRAATHGRGLWERKLDVAAMPDVDLYLRDHPMATARIMPTPSPVVAVLEDPRQHVTLGDNLWWWMCADVKVDAPDPTTHLYQLPVADVDYYAFETMLEHRNPQRGVLNRVYVQVHNRGIRAAGNVTVKLLYADASPGLPDLPADFWTAFPGNGTTTVWKPIGTAKVIATVSPKRPEIIEWDWVPPAAAATHSCLLVLVDSPDDRIPAASKVFAIGPLVTGEKRVGLKNLHVVDAPPAPYWFDVHVYLRAQDRLRLLGAPPNWSVGVLSTEAPEGAIAGDGLVRGKLTATELKTLTAFLGRQVKPNELRQFFRVANPAKGAALGPLPRGEKGARLLFVAQWGRGAQPGTMTLLQERRERVIGGNTFVLRPVQKR